MRLRVITKNKKGNKGKQRKREKKKKKERKKGRKKEKGTLDKGLGRGGEGEAGEVRGREKNELLYARLSGGIKVTVRVLTNVEVRRRGKRGGEELAAAVTSSFMNSLYFCSVQNKRTFLLKKMTKKYKTRPVLSRILHPTPNSVSRASRPSPAVRQQLPNSHTRSNLQVSIPANIPVNV